MFWFEQSAKNYVIHSTVFDSHSRHLFEFSVDEHHIDTPPLYPLSQYENYTIIVMGTFPVFRTIV